MNAHLLPRVSASLPNQNQNPLPLPRKIIRQQNRIRVLDSNSISTKPQNVHRYNDDTTDSTSVEFDHIWDQLLYSSSLPSLRTVTEIFRSLAKSGHFPRITRILSQLSTREVHPLLPGAFSAAISVFADSGQARLMEDSIVAMASLGFPVNSSAANARLRCHAVRGSLPEMEAAYAMLRLGGFCIDRPGIRAAASAYLRGRRLYGLSEFVRVVGLARADVGTLLWNLLLLSYAARFKMKSLQREFLRMVESGVEPDVTTFNVRALAFSRMSMMWDLHLSLDHMRRDGVAPDLVTYGCVVDAYVEKRLVRNLVFALNGMVGWSEECYPAVVTDPLVFEVMGKGDFHASAEAFMEFSKQTGWTYRKLVQVYTKKCYRKNQIFWNY